MSAMTLLNQCLELQEQEINAGSVENVRAGISKINFPSTTSIHQTENIETANVILITNK